MITIDARWLSVSGMGTYLRQLIPGVIAAFPGLEFTLLGNVQEIELLEFPRGSKVDIVAAKSKMYSLYEQIEIAREIPRKTELFFAPHYNIPLLYRGKMLVTVYDLYHLAMPELVGGFHKAMYARVMFNAVRRNASAIITISRFTRDELVRFTGLGRQAIYPIHLGVGEAWFTVERTQEFPGRPFLLYVGNVKPHKNLARLIQAFEMICDKTELDLVIAGKKEGFITGDDRVIADAARLGSRVRFTGRISDEALKQYVSRAEMLVFPSLYEGFGLPPLEAMAANCPVIVSNAASLPEICGDAAIYCDPLSPENIAEKILLMTKDHALRESMKKKGVELARRFTWGKCIDETCAVIDTLLHSGQTNGHRAEGRS